MINRRFYIGFSVAIGLVIVVGLVAYYSLKKQAQQQLWVEQTYKILNQTEYLGKLMSDMETGQRGFRATKDSLFLAPYLNAQEEIRIAFDSLMRHIAENGEENNWAGKLQGDIKTLDSFWKTPYYFRMARVDTAMRQLITTEKGYMDIIRTDIDDVNTRSNNLLKQRHTESEDALQQAILTVSLGSILILCIVTGLIAQVVSENKNRKKAEQSLKDKITELDRINEATIAANWQLTGLRSINTSLIGNDTLQELIQNCLQTIVDYLHLPCAVFYMYNKDSKDLVRKGAVALPGGIKDVFQPGEGITGMAATKRTVTVIKDIPKNYWQIGSATGSAQPDTLICVPLWKKNELIGVIEFGAFSSDTERYEKLLQNMADNIAIGISGAHAADLAANLLSTVQEQRDELESQQEELRQTNDELSHQAEVLRASEEELRTQEEELRQINAELEEKTEAVEQARRGLQEKAAELELSGKYKSEFLANMSHELRTPLNSVLILATMLKENKTQNLTAKQEGYASIIHKSGTDLLNLINDILDLSKIEAGKIDFNFEQITIEEIATDIEQLFTVVAMDKKVQFNISYGKNYPEELHTDKQRVEQVLKNLLSNAFKFTPEQGTVNLHFAGDKDWAMISVKDSGIGISESQQKLIFEAFQQADGSTSRKYGGTGLGLSISKELIGRMGGEIRLESKENEGSTFTIVLPVKEGGEKLQASPSHSDQPVANIDYQPHKVVEQTIIADDKPDLQKAERSILIIEDDVVFARLVNDFAHEKGFKTMIALSGDEGLHYARKYKPSAIILDLGLPTIDGRSLLKILKSDKELKKIPVHIISSEDRNGLPMDDIQSFIKKPLLSNELDMVFSGIDTYIRQHYQKILVLADKNTQFQDMFSSLSAEASTGVVYDIVATEQEALETIAQKQNDCIILDIHGDVQHGLELLKKLKEAAPEDVYVIICLEGDISIADEKQLKNYANSIIRKSVQANDRLMDEVELFLHKLKKPMQQHAAAAQYEVNMDATLEGKKVLIADDDIRNVFALTAMLEEHGIHVVSAENGREAIEELTRHTDIDLVLMDVMMPEMDGFAATKAIRAEKKWKNIPIIALTAKAMSGDRDKCLEAGASDYITKPVESHKLLSLMRVWTARK